MSMEQKDIAGLVVRLSARAPRHIGIHYFDGQKHTINYFDSDDETLLLEAASALTELSSTLAQRDARVKELEGRKAESDTMMTALQAKVEALSPHETCCCSYEAPHDLCMHHSPRVVDLHTALTDIIAADDEFRASMVPDVEKDPVTLACDRARALLRSQEPASGEAGT